MKVPYPPGLSLIQKKKKSTACRWKNKFSLVLATVDRVATKGQTGTNLFLLSFYDNLIRTGSSFK